MRIDDIIQTIENEDTEFYNNSNKLRDDFNISLIGFWVEKYESILSEKKINIFYDVLTVKDFVNSAFLIDHFNYSSHGKALLRVAYEQLFRILSEVLNLSVFERGEFKVYRTSKNWEEASITYFEHDIYYD